MSPEVKTTRCDKCGGVITHGDWVYMTKDSTYVVHWKCIHGEMPETIRHYFHKTEKVH